ncbi:MAG: recombinase family protein [Clostridiaceae bacterium]|jgi:DNA invertase Pin-like site-specific DNA recombinase|nr:recombinase family protein [Clostridiaceae bacterium]
MARYGYMLLDPADPDVSRQAMQLDTIGGYDRIFVDQRRSGAGTGGRIQRKKMLTTLAPGDVVYVAAADRLGDNMRDFLKVVRLINSGEADLVILQENVDTRDPSGRAALRLLKSVANIDFHFQSQRKKSGIETARRRGRRIGRPPVPIPPGFRDICRQWSEGRIGGTEAMRRSGLRSTSFYKKARELGFVAPSKRLRQESKDSEAPAKCKLK